MVLKNDTKMKKLTFLFTLFVFVVMAGCTSDPVKDDVVKYSNSIAPIMASSDAIAKKSDESGKETDPKALVNKFRKELLPMITELKTKLEAIKPTTKEVQDIHAAYLIGIRDFETGIKGLADAVEKHDQKLAKASTDKISAIGPIEEKFKKDFNELATKHNVKLQ